MLAARMQGAPTLSARLSAPAPLSASVGAQGAAPLRPATRELLGGVVVGDGLDVGAGGLLSVAPEVRDYDGLANKPSIEGAEVAGALTAAGLGLATARELADAMAGKADDEEIPTSFIEAL